MRIKVTMTTYTALLAVSLWAGVALAAGADATSTATVTLEGLVAGLGDVVEGFRSGVLPGLAAAFALALGTLNFGPLAKRLAASRLDWLGPLLTLVAMVGGAIVGALGAGQAAGDAVLAGVGVLFVGGGPVVQQLIRDVRD